VEIYQQFATFYVKNCGEVQVIDEANVDNAVFDCEPKDP